MLSQTEANFQPAGSVVKVQSSRTLSLSYLDRTPGNQVKKGSLAVLDPHREHALCSTLAPCVLGLVVVFVRGPIEVPLLVAPALPPYASPACEKLCMLVCVYAHVLQCLYECMHMYYNAFMSLCAIHCVYVLDPP